MSAMPQPLAKVLEFAPRATREPLVHVSIQQPAIQVDPLLVAAARADHPARRPFEVRPIEPRPFAGPVETEPWGMLFDWDDHPDLPPVMPTLVACAIDRLGQFLCTTGMISRDQAFEALQVIRGYWRPETSGGGL